MGLRAKAAKTKINYVLEHQRTNENIVKGLVSDLEDTYRDITYKLKLPESKNNGLADFLTDMKRDLEKKYVDFIKMYGDDAHSDYFQDQIQLNYK